MFSRKQIIDIIFLLTLFLWGSAYIAIRIGIKTFPPGDLAFLRYFIASIAMLIIYSLKKPIEIPKLNDFPLIAIVGFFGFSVYNIALNYGEITVSPGSASFIIGQAPVLTTLLAIIFLNERLKKAGWIGFFLSITGVYFIAEGEKNGLKFDWGIIYLILSTLSAATYIILQKFLLRKYHAITVTAYAIWFGTLFMGYYLPSTLKTLPQSSSFGLVVILYLGIFPAALGFLGWSYVNKEIPAAKAAAGLYALPILTTFMDQLILGEHAPKLVWCGGILSLIGAFIVKRNVFIKNSRT